MTDQKPASRPSTILSDFLQRTVLRRRPPQPASPPIDGAVDFDWELYRANHRDLWPIRTAADAFHHYHVYGRAEGRLASAADFERRIAALQRDYGPLPPDFVWTDYLNINHELDDIHASHAAIEHYLRKGRDEGRLYRKFDADLYKSINFPHVELPRAALIEHFREVGQRDGLVATLDDIVARHGLKATGWLERLDVNDFALLNAGWAGPIANKLEAADAMVRAGFDRLAPISFALDFDPAYYKEANPGLAPLDPPALYRQWLFEGLGNDRPGNPAEHLRRHGLALAGFPEGFDWQRYAGLRGVFGNNRWALLDHVVANNELAADDIPVHPAGAGTFLAALAGTISDRVPARGEALFAAAQRYGALATTDQEQWGNALARQKRWPEALDHYALALDGPHPTISAVVSAAHTAGDAGDFPRAVDILRRGRATIGGDLRYRQAVRTCLEQAYEAAWKQAETLYASDRRSEADRALDATTRNIARWWSVLDPTGLPVPAEPERRVVLLANVDLAQCTHYRVRQKQEIFEAAGIPLQVFTQAEYEGFISALPGAAAALYYRLPASPMNIRAIEVARALGIPTYYDIDDLIFDPVHYPEPIETYGASTGASFYRSLQLGVPLFRAAMGMCDTAIASTTYLAEHMRPVVRSGEAFVLPNGLDSTIADYLTFRIPKVRRNDEVVLIYGSGTRAHNADFLELVGGALTSLMARHTNVRLIIAGYLSLDERFEAVRDRIVQVGWSRDLEAYWSLLAEADINLAVLIPGATTEGKSEIKWLEAAAMGVPSVVSATHRYAEVLTDGVDALFARSAQDWHDALESLITNPARREALVVAARAKARACYGVDRNADRLKALLAPAFAAATRRDIARPAPKKRILLVNIFFPPQTIGGSTRVARDNLDSFLDSPFAQECDFAVVTTDNDNPVPFQLRVDDYKGVPVFRMSTPIETNMEWRPFNPAIGAVFRRILDIWQPDLVHVHSIQRSTASILEECWAKDIPYINTIHDAWWVADYHFLVDDKGRLRETEEPLPLNPPPPVSLGEALERRRRLRILLDHSAAILCVSDAFTAIHHKAGYPRVRSVPNGVPPMPAIVRTPSASGRVRLAQISSQTHHKGYHLIQAALKQGHFRNLELTVVEHGRFGGRVERTMWGETPVSFVGKTKQEDMHTFYATVDVLLCPSVWPESFGLVAREAVAAGLWVVASDRGAIGENVRPGVNGWVIDVATLDPLIQTFAEMDADPARFLLPPPRVTEPPRTAQDQAHDVVAIYGDVLARPRPAEPWPYFMRGGFALEPVLPPTGALARPPRRPHWP